LSPKPYRLLLALSVAVLAAVGPVLAAGSEPHWTLEQAGRSYTYSVTVASDLPAAVLLNVLFDPQHVAVFSRSAGRLSVLRQDGDVNEVRFDTRHFFYKCSSTFRRTRDRETATITIDMLSFTAGWGKLAPQALASRARYTVADKGTDREVVYRQDVETDRPVSGISLRLLRKSLREFARDLQEYLQRPELRRDAGMPAGAPVEPRGAR
jgi:hypothetical protein